MYQTKFGPSYRVSYCASIGLLSVTLSMLGLTWYLARKGDREMALVDTTTTSHEGGEAVPPVTEHGSKA